MERGSAGIVGGGGVISATASTTAAFWPTRRTETIDSGELEFLPAAKNSAKRFSICSAAFGSLSVEADEFAAGGPETGQGLGVAAG